MVGFSLPSDLIHASSLTDRVNQLDSVSVGYPKDGGLSQKVICPALMNLEESKQTGANRKSREKMDQILYHPPIEGSVSYSLEGKKKPKSDYLTWIEA
jgi:hypothetical protein